MHLHHFMLAVPGYRSEKLLHSAPGSAVVAAVREADGLEVVLKSYHLELAAGQARREFDLLRAVDGSGAVRALEIVEHGTKAVLVLESVPGVSLRDYVRACVPSVPAFLEIALQLAVTLEHLRHASILHRDLHPGNVLVDPTTLRTRLIDFGNARQLLHSGRRETGSRSGLSGLVGPLHFIAPEQTGRMDRGVDHRSDLYGLGATLYFALTGATPFEGSTKLALIHAHMARMPVPPVERCPGTSIALSRIVVKLLEKEPEERYQSAQALHCDLAECLAQWKRSGRIDDDLPLASADAPLRPLFAKKLYGREADVESLRRAFDAAAQARTQWVVITGASGTGKSALVHELRRAVAGAGGYLVSGKYELDRRDVPYVGWLAALHSLTHQILAESDEALAHWREELRAALGAIAGALVELIPDLGLVLGEVPSLPVLGPRETQARLALAMQRLLSGCARPERPLVLFLDDLQWADPGSRQLLESLPVVKGAALLVIGAYRDAEVDPTHPLLPVLESLARGLPCTRIELGELAAEARERMLADALGRTQAEVRSLADVVVRKIGSNPLLIQQFVLHLHTHGWLRFAHSRGWEWDVEAIAAADVPDGAVAMLVSKLSRLDPEARELIEFASCVGYEFDLSHLLELSGSTEARLEPALLALLEEGLVVPSPGGFRFAHDRIQEAAHSLLDGVQRAALHLGMARLLQASVPPAALGEHAFELADHWNHALATLQEEDRRAALAANAAAGTRALRAGSAGTANTYLGVALRLVCEADWERDRPLVFRAFIGAAEAAYQIRELDAALGYLDLLELRGLGRTQRALVDIQRISALALTMDAATIDVVLGALQRLGIRYPRRPSLPRALAAMLWTAWRIGSADECVFRRVASRDETVELADRIIQVGSTPIIQHSVLLRMLTSCRCLRMAARHGVTDSIALALASFANGWREAGFSRVRWLQYVRAAQHWIAAIPSPMHLRAQFVLDCYALVYTGSRRARVESLRKLRGAFQEVGDHEGAHYATSVQLHYLLLCGEPLDSKVWDLLVPTASDASDAAVGAAADPVPAILRDWSDAILVGYQLLRISSSTPVDWSAALARAESRQADALALVRTAARIHWALVLCIAGEHALACEHMDRFADSVKQAEGVGGTFLELAMVRGVCAAALASAAPRGAARRHRRTVARSVRMLASFAKRAPDFVHMHEFLAAEQAALRGAAAQALRLYGRASQNARACGYRHHAALIAERRAALLQARRRSSESLTSLREALDLYREWGAHGKVQTLERVVGAGADARPRGIGLGVEVPSTSA